MGTLCFTLILTKRWYSAPSLPIQEVERLEGLDATNPTISIPVELVGMTLENWQVAHFRILGHDKYAPYGSSVLEPVRRIWRQLTLMEDAMMACVLCVHLSVEYLR